MTPEFTAESLLPPLRLDIVIEDGGADASGAMGIVIYDPVRHQFFRLPQFASRVLPLWDVGVAGLAAQLSGIAVSDVGALHDFLRDQRLLAPQTFRGETLAKEKLAQRRPLASRIVHGYLSFRVPLIDPTWMLDLLLPVGRTLAARPVVFVAMLIGVIGFYFTSRQWDQYASTFLDFFSAEGAALYAVTLVLLKIFHELGHGLVARHYGVQVPVMGIGFMVLTPMLYTEVSDAWRLKNKNERLLIAAAGLLVEFAIAALALFAWAFLPDGPWRSAAYFVSSVAIIGSLFVNLSPFMRFDGYHMLADALGMHNLGPRAFALTNWQWRRWLFGVADAPPEIFPRALHRFLVAYSFGTWIYRLTLFGGIALLVYHMFPKAVGLPLAAVEIGYFILLPIIRELRNLQAMGLSKLFAPLRAKIHVALLLAGGALCFIPLDQHVTVPAVMMSSREAWVYPPESAQVAEVRVQHGARVAKGDVLVTFTNPDIEQKLKLARLQLALVEGRLQRVAGDAKELQQRRILEQQRATNLQDIAGQEARLKRLGLRAPIDGVIDDVMPGLKAGAWVGAPDLLMHLDGGGRAVALGLVGERDAVRIGAGANAWFVSEDGAARRVSGMLQRAGVPGAEGIALRYLSAQSGGPIAVGKGEQGASKPLQAVLPVEFSFAGAAPLRAARGTVVVAAEKRSLAQIAFARIAAVALRESGF